MSSEQALRERLRKVEELICRAETVGEQAAALAAANRIRMRLENGAAATQRETKPFSWTRQVDPKLEQLRFIQRWGPQR
jgi:hypothetical protein